MGESVVTLRQAFEILDRWMLDARVSLTPEPRGLDVILRETTAANATLRKNPVVHLH